jgi:hypothetical protein
MLVSEQFELTSELNKILGSEPFRGAEMLSRLLRYLAERAIEHPGIPAKEFQVATEALGRSSDFDPRLDSNVRVLTGRLRTKLLEYYATIGSTDQIVLEIPKGTYVLHVHQREVSGQTDQTVKEAHEQETQTKQKTTNPNRRWLWTWVVLSVAIVLAVITAWKILVRKDALDQFWNPVLSSTGPALICMGQVHVGEASLSPNGSRSRFTGTLPICSGDCPEGNGRGFVALFDSLTAANVGSLLTLKNKKFIIRDQGSTSFSDLRRGSFVLIGAFSNDWTIRLTDPLRFHFDLDPASQESWIADRLKPGKKIGLERTRTDKSFPVRKEDFAIVARFFDPATGQTAVVLAGLGGHATQAAGEFVTSKSALGEALKQAPAGWERKNVELVISTEVVDGVAGPPRVVATVLW